MTIGYQHYDILRMAPANGDDVTLDLMTAFTDFGGPTSTVPTFDLEADSKDDINRSYRPVEFGYRMNVQIIFDLFEMTDEATLRTILDRAADQKWDLFLSIDGGENEYEVRLRRSRGPKPHAKKTIAGNEWRLDFRAVDLLDEIPASDPSL